MKKQILLTLTLLGLSIGLFAQTRYMDEVFSEVSVEADIVFSTNFGFFSGFAAEDTLKMDIYQPMGDTVSSRPLIILMHPGSFLPKGINTLPFGDRKDSAMVEMCTQFAKRGFVAVASSYRAGWNPASSDQDVRGGTIITANVLGALDAKNCIRFFRQDAAGDNTYRIDPDKVTLGGTNTGGYVALAANNFDEPADLELLKFRNSMSGESYFDTTLHGNFDGVGGSVNVIQYEGIDGDPNLILNMGGAAGDTSIFNEMDAPVVSITGRNDPLTPDSVGVVVVSGAGGVVPVIEVHGGLVTSRYLTSIGVNSVFGSVSGDPYTERAEANLLLTGKDPADYLGYYQIQDPATGYEPWGWYDPNDPNIAQSTDPDSANFIPGATGSGSRANPFATKEKALAHIDTVMGFFVPRAMVALGLNMEDSIGTSIDQNLRIDAGLDIFPNPTANTLTIRVGNSAMPIRGMQLIDMSGRVVASLTATRAYEYTLERNRLVDGVYVLKVDFDAGSVTERVLFAGN
ncbi:MAG: T9SS type A sorting domain-containing protein [Bacteroidota bacterium]